MSRFRISIGGLSALILAAGIVMAAARSPNESWSNGSTSLTLLALGVASAGVVLFRGTRRAYCLGFAGLGWGYLVLAFGPWCDSHIAPLLINKTIGEYLHFTLGQYQSGRVTLPVFYARQIPGTHLRMFGHQQVAHSLSALLLGLLGGSMASRFASAGPSKGRSTGEIVSMRNPNLVVSGAILAGLMAITWGVAYQPPPPSWGEFAANGTFCAGLLTLGLAWIAAAIRRGPGRDYWLGFALVGSGYLVLVYGPWFDGHVAQLLITETALKAFQEKYGPYRQMFPNGDVAEQAQYAPRLIGHTLAAIGSGIIGGSVARKLAEPVDRKPE